MITKLTIQNFRGLQNLILDRLRRVNLLVGGNDTGKTSVLEALNLLLGDSNSVAHLPFAFRNSGQRNLMGPFDEFTNFWTWLHNDHNPENRICLTATTLDKGEVSVHSANSGKGKVGFVWSNNREFRVGEGGHESLNFQAESPLSVARLSIHPTSPVDDAEKLNQVALYADGEQRIEHIMREVNPAVKRLRYAKLPGTNAPLIYVDIGLSQSIPAPQMGQAFNRLLHIYTNILSSRANILLVDEIENGIFTENLLPIWKGLLKVCTQENIQIFATTHSLECVHAALAASTEQGKEDLVVQRLQAYKNQIEAVALSQETCTYAIANGMEIRK